MLISKALGGVLLIVGTSVGAGMLALPLALSQSGFWLSTMMLTFCWAMMYIAARLMLTVNLAFPAGSHMITMAEKSLGRFGVIVTWISCLGLLYTLLAAYIAGGSDILRGLLSTWIHLPNWVLTVLFTFIFGCVVYAGIRCVDYTNRILMFCKIGIYLVLVIWLGSQVKTIPFLGSDVAAAPGNIMILITSFGFASIVPSLRYYFQDHIPLLKRVIFLGSIIPLICYITWNLVMVSVIGRDQLITLSKVTFPLSALIKLLAIYTHHHDMAQLFSLFTTVCILTAFLGVALGLYDFLSDGLHLRKQGVQGILLFVITFFPSMLVVILKPGIYLHALNYAGYFCVLFLLVLPACMVCCLKKGTLCHLA